MAATKTMNFTEGPILGNLIRFSLPIVLGNLLQQIYTAADRVVVGQFAQDSANALAAIGATSSPINLIIGLFVGIATGSNVICANLLGARNTNDLRKSMHTAVLLSFWCGLALLVGGILTVPLVLRWMDTPEAIFGQAALYMRIYFVGVPASLVFNISSGILRAYGDTKRPMFILILSGMINVLLNLVFVIVFDMGVAGVAVATAISHLIAGIAVLWILFRKKDQYRLTVRELHIDKQQMLAVIRIGVPSGLSSMVFSASNVILQSAVNSFDNAAIIAAKTAAFDINTLIYQIEGALLAACVSFSGQCYGAKRLERIDKVAATATVLCYAAMAVFIIPCIIFSDQVIGLFNREPEVIRYGSNIQKIMNLGLFLYIPSEIYLGCSRGMRRVIAPTLINIAAICGVRILWLMFVFPSAHTIEALYYCYPVSWGISSALQAVYYICVRRRINKEKAKLLK